MWWLVDVAVDLVMLSVAGGALSVLVVLRRDPPYRGAWALPGGRVRPDEDLPVSALRKLDEQTGLGTEVRHLEQIHTYGAPGRDPRGRVISVAYLAVLANLPAPTAGPDAAQACWQPVDAVGELAFDHDVVLSDGLEGTRAKIANTTFATTFCADEFTVPELRTVYEAIWDTRLDERNFHRKVTTASGFLQPTGRHRTHPSNGRPAHLYRCGSAEILLPALPRPRTSHALCRPVGDEAWTAQ